MRPVSPQHLPCAGMGGGCNNLCSRMIASGAFALGAELPGLEEADALRLSPRRNIYRGGSEKDWK